MLSYVEKLTKNIL